MPELPEVETVVRDLRPMLVGRKLTALSVSKHALRQPWRSRWNAGVVGTRVQAVSRRGKWIRIDLGGPQLLVHLGMTGQFTVVTATTPREDHTHLVFRLDAGRNELRFRDVRRFGSVTWFADQNLLERHLSDKGLGPEPFDVQPVYWRDRLARARRNLKAVLLDQTVVAGVGNIYADESLFAARLNPNLLASQLSPAHAEKLRSAIVAVLERAITSRGSSIRDYIGGSGLKGSFQEEFCVYGRGGEPCSRCGMAIEVIRLAGRSTHFCPKCQPKRPRQAASGPRAR